jgi:hypothetical protein
MRRHLSCALVTLVLALVAAPDSLSAATVAEKTLSGTSLALGAGTASSWVRTDASGAPTAMGVTVGDAAFTHLGETPTDTVLPLPELDGLPFRSVVMNWNPKGHPPVDIYGVPHFDVHFYEIDEPTRLAIGYAPADKSIAPSADLVPGGFAGDPGGTVPTMGWHYGSKDSPEFHGKPFAATFIYGYNAGRPDFIEVMAANSYLTSHPAVSAPIPQPAAYGTPGWYPTMWHIAYDPAAKQTTIVLDGFKKR